MMAGHRVDPAGGPLRGELRPPGDKSIAQRALILAAMADGGTLIENLPDSDDVLSARRAIADLGAETRVEESPGGVSRVTVSGVGLAGAEDAGLDVGNSGTLMRMLPGWLAGQHGGHWRLDGDASIRRRPIDRIVEPLGMMGAQLEGAEGDVYPPLKIDGVPLRGIAYTLPVPSAQVKSCLLLAGLLAAGSTTVIERLPSRDHTERMLIDAGATVDIADNGAEGRRRVTVERAERIALEQLTIPGDFSAAAFFVVAATIVPGSELRLRGVGLNPTRTGLLAILERMGGDIEVAGEWHAGSEPIGELVVRSAALTGAEVARAEVPLAIDELPLVALIGCFAEGETVVHGAGELRHKESDRIAGVVEGLRGLGAEIEALPDGFAVTGTGGLRGGDIDPRGDHRLAMLGAIAGLASREGVGIGDLDVAAVSYPGFAAALDSLAGAC
jgi:3-phosphoshikimate 1-carboxyvinyltransferase